MAMSTMYPKFAVKRDGDFIIMEQRLLKTTSQLHLNAKKCTGCGVCSEVCPKEAITLGMVGAAIRGKANGDAAINVDPAKCSYCGVCTIMCPFNSLEVFVDGKPSLPIREREGFPEYDFKADIDEKKCNRCTTCSEACPHDAIRRDVPNYEGTGGDVDRHVALDATVDFKVDKNKCDVCGICGSLCPAITVEREEFCGGDPKRVAGEVVWDETKCDACNVCADACPQKAISVKRNVKKDAKLAGNVSIDKKECITCTWCKTVCPEEAITVTKFFDGEVTFNPEKCPGGCSTCVTVCPCHAIYLPTPVPATELRRGMIEPNIAVNHDLCIMCGACVNACPSEDAIVLKRTGVHFKGTMTDLAKKVEAKLCVPRTSKLIEKKFGEVELKME